MCPVNHVFGIIISKKLRHLQTVDDLSALSVKLNDLVIHMILQGAGQNQKISIRLFFNDFMVRSVRNKVHLYSPSEIIHFIQNSREWFCHRRNVSVIVLHDIISIRKLEHTVSGCSVVQIPADISVYIISERIIHALTGNNRKTIGRFSGTFFNRYHVIHLFRQSVSLNFQFHLFNRLIVVI